MQNNLNGKRDCLDNKKDKNLPWEHLICPTCDLIKAQNELSFFSS